MKKTIQSYLVFTTIQYRIILMTLPPILAVSAPFLLGILLGNPMITDYYLLAAFFSCEVMLFFEIILDNWCFGGIAAKDGGLPTCLNTSKRGKGFVKGAVLVNMGRQLIGLSLVLLCVRIIFCRGTGEAFWSIDGLLTWAGMILLSYFFMILGVTLARYAVSLLIQLLIEGGVALLFALSTLIFVLGMVPAIIIVLVLCLLISVISIKIIMKKEADSYYDQTD